MSLRITPRPALQHVPDGHHGGPSSGGALGTIPYIDFSTSVNAYGPAPSVVDAIRGTLDPERIAAYPDPSCRAARTALATHDRVDLSAVAVGAGATELILAIAMAFVRRGDRVLVPPRAFAEYLRATMLCSGRIVSVSAERSPSLQAPLSDVVADYRRAIIAHAPRVAFLCSPESPAGRAWTRDDLLDVADTCWSTGTLLVLDQSFDAFTAAPLGTPALRDHPAVLHLRSLTKDHALAGIRLGYLVGPPALVTAVERARMPWTVCASAQTAAVAVCAPDAVAHACDTTTRLRTAAVDLRASLRMLGVTTWPSDAHYFLIAVGNASDVTRRLRERHAIQVRDCSSFGLPAYVRIATRTASENGRLVTAFAALQSDGDIASVPNDGLM